MLRVMLLCIIISALMLSPVEAQQNPGLGESITPTTNVGPIDYCALLYRGGRNARPLPH